MKKILILLIFVLNQFTISFGQNDQFSRSEIKVTINSIGESYSVLPIFASPGRLGIKPQISVSISSNNSTGIIGKGGKINGISNISRIGSNFHINGKQESIKFNSEDEFQLDGNMLVLVSGLRGNSGSKYRTTSDIYSEIEFLGDYFIVKLKDGSTCFYGQGNNSSYFPTGSTVPLTYSIYKSFDKLGNFIEYFYNNTDNQSLISTIKYTGFDPTINGTKQSNLSSELPFNKMEFIYENGITNTAKYITGFPISNNKRLVRIDCFTKPASDLITSPKKIRHYDFNYVAPSSLDLINSIQEFNENDDSYEPIIFNWQNALDNYSIKSGTTPFNLSYYDNNYEGYMDYLHVFGNFTGNGEKELLRTGNIVLPNSFKSSNNFKGQFYIKTITKNHFNNVDLNNNNNKIFQGTFSEPTDYLCDFTNLLVGDLDCDGDDDVLIQKVQYNKLSDPTTPNLWSLGGATVHYYACISEFNETAKSLNFKGIPDYFAPIQIEFPILHFIGQPNELSYMKCLKFFVHLKDFDGDGKLDLLTESRKSNIEGLSINLSHSNSQLFYHNGNTPSSVQLLNTTISNQYSPLDVGDLNGNGKADLFVITSGSSFSIREFNGYDFQEINTFNIGTAKYLQHKFGDFNGDGNFDILMQLNEENAVPNNLFWNQYIGTGTGSFYLRNIIFNFSSDYYRFPGANVDPIKDNVDYADGKICNSFIHIGDVNGDGLDDIFYNFHHSNNHFHKLLVSNGLDFIEKPINISFNIYSPNLKYIPKGGLVDIFGNGKAVFYGENGKIIEFSFEEFNLTEILNNNFQYKFTFKYLTDLSCRYSKSNVPLYNNVMEYKMPIKILQSIEEFRYSSFYQKNDFFYKDLLYNRHGYGVIGFRVVANYNSRSKITTIEERRVNSMELGTLQTMSISNYRSTNNTGLFPTEGVIESERKTFYKIIFPVPGIKMINSVLLSYEINKDFLKEIQKEICYDYDLFGNLIVQKERISKFTDLSKPEFLKEINFSYGKFNSWIPSNLITESIVQLRITANNVNQIPYKKTTNFIINALGLTEESKEFEAFTSLYRVNGITYDKYGNIVSTYQKNSNSTGPERISTFTYDKGRFLSESHLYNGESKYTIYEEVYGNLIQETTSFAKNINYSYNFWGKVNQATDWFGNTVNHNYSIVSIIIPNQGSRVCKKIETISSLGNTETNFYDASENLVLKSKSVYTKNNQIYLTSQRYSYYENGLSKDVSNWFDPLNETTTIRWKRSNYDIFDRLTSISKLGIKENLISYIYEGNKVTENQYITSNEAGGDINKITVKEYGITGQIEKLTDQGQVTNFTFGSHDKVLQIVSSDETITMNYNARLDLIEKNTTTSGTETFAYYPYGEIKNSTDQNGNLTSFSYNDIGQLLLKNINSNITYKYYYYTNPTLGSIGKLQKEEFYDSGNLKHSKNYTYNSFGKAITISENIVGLGNFNTSYNYDVFGRISEEIFPNISIRSIYDISNNLTEKQYKIGSNWVPLWKLNSFLFNGSVTQSELGNGIINDYTYNSVDWALNSMNLSHSSNLANSITNYQITRDLNLNGSNIKEIISNGNIELFEYDNFDRLTKYSLGLAGQTSNMVDREFQYYPNGSLQNKFDAGNFEYNSNPYRPSSNQYQQINTPFITNQSLSENQSILYNHYNKVLNIIQNNKELNIVYGLDENRINTNVKVNSSVVYDAYYINSANMEIVNGNENTYIYAGNQPVAIFNSTTSNLYYLHLDVMGSLTTITDISGNVVERRNYDPWGRPRNPNTLEYSLNNPFGSNTTLSTLRGFTFHEHLDWFDLINMNGRMFDTHLSQFLNADPFITDYTNSQTYNRYCYVSNNPLKYTDPTGYIGSNPGSGPSTNIASNGSSISTWNSLIKSFSFLKYNTSETMSDFISFPEEPIIRKTGASATGSRNMGLAQFGNHNPYYQLNWKQNSSGLYNLYNASDFTIYFKPESTMTINGVIYDNANSYPLSPGQSFNYRIDGIGIPGGRPGEIFKVKDFMDSSLGIKVYNNSVIIGEIIWPISNDLNELFGGGWKGQDWLNSLHKLRDSKGNLSPDHTWDSLFNRVR